MFHSHFAIWEIYSDSCVNFLFAQWLCKKSTTQHQWRKIGLISEGVDYMAVKWRRMYSISLCFSRPLLFFSGMIFYEFPLTWEVGRAYYFVKFTKSKNHSIWMVWFFHSLQKISDRSRMVVLVCSFNSHFCLSRHWRHSPLPELTDVIRSNSIRSFLICSIWMFHCLCSNSNWIYWISLTFYAYLMVTSNIS